MVLIAARTLLSGGRVREAAALRGAAIDMRGLVRDAAQATELHGRRSEERDLRESELQGRLYRITVWLVALAALTLAAAVVTLAVSLVA